MSPKRTPSVAGEKTPAEESAAFKRRLERLAVKILGLRISSGQEFWAIELELLKLQRDIQAAITKRKSSRLTADQRKETEELRHALWHARRFGDTLAWLLFDRERRWIYPLAENDRAPVLPDGHASRGLIGAAEAMSERFGLPLLHDITDLLRVGDVSFFHRDKPPQTVEIKTDVLDSKTEGNITTIKYNVTAIWPADGPPPKGARVKRPARPSQPSLASKRFHRQLERMTRAHVIRTAELGKPAEIGGEKTLMIAAQGERRPSHWPLLRRLVRQAKRTGYASGVAERAILFVVLYSKDGFESDDDRFKRVATELVPSGIFLDDPEKNALWVSALPDPRGDGPHMYLPYFLYPLPRSAVFDLLHRRLLILSLLNLGRIAAALEEVGLKVEIPWSRSRAYLRVFTEIEIDGGRYLVELVGLQENIREMIMEASSISYVVGMAQAMSEGVAEQMPLILPDMDRGRTRRLRTKAQRMARGWRI